MKIVFGSDHIGLDLKRQLIEHVRALGHDVSDVGPETADRVDYPVYGSRAARLVASGECDLGIVVCGSGVGISLAANKVPGIRCATVSEPYSAAMSREHNDANMLAMGSRVVGAGLATLIVDAWLAASFEGDRHARRVQQLSDLEAGAVL